MNLLRTIFLITLYSSISANSTKASINRHYTCEEKVGQMFLVSGYFKPSPITGGVLLYSYNFRKDLYRFQVKNTINELKESVTIPPFIAIDQEGGEIQRLKGENEFTEVLSHKEIGEKDSTTLAYVYGRIIGEELSSVGINWNFGTVLDLNTNIQNPVIAKRDRSFGTKTRRVTDLGYAMLRGQSEQNIITTLKHFPGHGDTSTDSHTDLAFVNKTKQELESNELKPFLNILKKDYILPTVMMGHITIPQVLGQDSLPASLSREIVTGWLRKSYDFNGLIVTDDLNMKAISDYYGKNEAVELAIKAGNDVLILGALNTQAQLDLANYLCKKRTNDRLLKREIESSFNRILLYKEKYGLLKNQ